MHYMGIVIGPDVAGQLARYDENLDVEPYIATCGWCDGESKYQPCENCEDTGKETTTRNPQGVWDYWRVGGRYRGRLLLKPGATGELAPLSWEWSTSGAPKEDWTGRADIATKGAIDLDAMRAQWVNEEGPYRSYTLVAEGVLRSKLSWDLEQQQWSPFPGDWVAFWDRMIDGLGDDVLLTVVDYHS